MKESRQHSRSPTTCSGLGSPCLSPTIRFAPGCLCTFILWHNPLEFLLLVLFFPTWNTRLDSQESASPRESNQRAPSAPLGASGDATQRITQSVWIGPDLVDGPGDLLVVLVVGRDLHWILLLLVHGASGRVRALVALHCNVKNNALRPDTRSQSIALHDCEKQEQPSTCRHAHWSDFSAHICRANHARTLSRIDTRRISPSTNI